jgi:hypothetical protein
MAHASSSEAQYGVVLNPPKSGVISFAETDRIIVIAES